MSTLLQNILEFCSLADLDTEEVDECTFRYSEEEISNIPVVLYLRQNANLELIIVFKELGMHQLRKNSFQNVELNAILVKPRSLIIPLNQKNVSEVLLEITKKICEVFKCLENSNKLKLTSIQSEDGIDKFQILLKSLNPENELIHLNHSLYSSIFQKPDLWLADFFIEIEKKPVFNKINILVFIELKKAKELIYFKSLQNIDPNQDLKTILIDLNLVFHGKIYIKKDFFECFYQDDCQWCDFSLEKTSESGISTTFKISNIHGQDVIEYEEESSDFLLKAFQKNKRAIQSLNISAD